VVPATISSAHPRAHGQRGLNPNRHSSFEFNFNSINFLFELDGSAQLQGHTALVAHHSEHPTESSLIGAFEYHGKAGLTNANTFGAPGGNKPDPVVTIVDVEDYASRRLADPATRTPVRHVQVDVVKVTAQMCGPDGQVNAVVVCG